MITEDKKRREAFKFNADLSDQDIRSIRATAQGMTTYEYDDYYKILPTINQWDQDSDRIKKGKKVNKDFIYSSDNNSSWMDKKELLEFLKNEGYLNQG